MNRTVGSVFDSPKAGALPLGRHSIMNGVSFGGGDTSDQAIKDFVAFFSGLTSVWKRIFEWASQEAGRLAAAAGWDNLESVPLVDWLDRNPTSTGASVDAYSRFVEYDLPAHPLLRELVEARTEFLEGVK